MKKAQKRIMAIFEFGRIGYLKSIFLNAETQEDQRILQKGLLNLLKPQKFNSIRKLFRRPVNGN
jgi:hypothetical protein